MMPAFARLNATQLARDEDSELAALDKFDGLIYKKGLAWAIKSPSSHARHTLAETYISASSPPGKG